MLNEGDFIVTKGQIGAAREHNSYVNFPAESDEWMDSGEGGMFVRLVVIDPDLNTDNQWMQCSGGWSYLLMDEALVGQVPEPNYVCDCRQCVEYREVGGWDHSDAHYHFTHATDGRPIVETGEYHYVLRSRPYLAALTLGSTTRSMFWEDADDYMHYFVCTYRDLTAEGRALYDSLQALYGERAVLYLQTWLDT